MHVHAIVFSAWVGLLAVQAALVSQGKVGVHRRVGRLGAGLLPIMVVTGLMTAVRGARDGWNPGGPYPDALSFMFVGIADMIVFTGLTSAGLALRGRPDLHKRLMLLGTIGGLMWPAIARMPLVAGRFGLMFGLLTGPRAGTGGPRLDCRGACSMADSHSRRRRARDVSLRVAVGNSAAWRSFAAWVIQ